MENRKFLQCYKKSLLFWKLSVEWKCEVKMTGFLASSKAGHDKNKIYVIIKEDAEYVWLSDGKIKTMDNPKKKRKKHLILLKSTKNSLLSSQIFKLVVKL